MTSTADREDSLAAGTMDTPTVTRDALTQRSSAAEKIELFLALPVSWRGTIAQYVGRLHRLHEGKREVRVYDYADLDVPMLSRMFDRRCQGYEAVGYAILLPASALPGWPADVPLPVDAEWKRDYAASVRRLIRDGVDTPLANLFVHAARTPLPEAEGIDRARSASEAFLYHRLGTLAWISHHREDDTKSGLWQNRARTGENEIWSASETSRVRRHPVARLNPSTRARFCFPSVPADFS
ncbi:MAG TPA: hypothetical protein PLY00_07320 [Verrucomicrobiota bacterium]|jgi:hypothetical protein|nr:hypothetical protein [Verrucomicrobiota bacterium]HOG87765.1 hypothetical protein [Verrucomicrobiota bacterium]HOR71084.1 hypothetical protein [Verrucomicrobiota bacterium]HOU87188.1 hypothetical protein [Verrucomicrobiota bacterium]HPK97278.1 hypothetical protein [Verrucomicrobiota bacterium]